MNESRILCVICRSADRSGVAAFCLACQRSYDRHTKRDDGTLMSVMTWAAKRSWYFASRQQTAKRKAARTQTKTGERGPSYR